MRPWSCSAAVGLLALGLTAQRAQGKVWDHLQKTYDQNGDGKITLEEYGRSQRSFRNLDRNHDEQISADDFARRGRRRSASRKAPDRRERLSHRLGDLFGSFFNRDGKPGLSKAEWARVVATLRPNADGIIARDQLRALFGQAGKGRMAGFVTKRLPQILDMDEDGAISVGDMNALFALLDQDGDGLIEQGKEIDMPPGVGELAPGFTLPYADDPTKKISLSEFRGKKPVALIFGSYT